MRCLLALVAIVALFVMPASSTAQCYDTCAPHRHGYFGYVGTGYGFGGGHGRMMRGPVRPFQGLVNPRYLPSPVEYVVVAPANHMTQPQVYLPRDIRERKQAEMEIASDGDLLREPQSSEPAPPRQEQYESHAPGVPRRTTAAPPRKTPQPDLIAARAYASTAPQHAKRGSRMTGQAADDYVARSAAALARLKAGRAQDSTPTVAGGSSVAASATDNVLRN